MVVAQMSCLLVGGAMMILSGSDFTLDWHHSIERISWRERWSVTEHGLRLTQAAVQGSGAGMEPGQTAILRDGWWEWSPELGVVPSLTLAASGATMGGWRLCDGAHCQVIGESAQVPIHVRPCD